MTTPLNCCQFSINISGSFFYVKSLHATGLDLRSFRFHHLWRRLFVIGQQTINEVFWYCFLCV